MSFSPPIIPQAQVIEQIKGLTTQQDHLLSQIRLAEEKLRLIQASLSENEALKARIHELMDQSLGFFQEEWMRKSEYFPDIRMLSLMKAVELVAPPTKKLP